MSDLHPKQVPWDIPLSEASIDKVLKLCRLKRGIDYSAFNLLDFGCGNGRYLEAFATVIPRENIVGVDIDPERIALACKKGFSCSLLDIEGDVLPFKEEYFDMVYSSNVIEHIPRKKYYTYLQEVCRVLKPGGQFIVGTPNYPAKRLYDIKKAFKTRMFRYYLFDDPTHCNKLSIMQLEKDLNKIFHQVDLQPTKLLFQRYLPFLRFRRVRYFLRFIGDKVVGRCVK